MLAAAGLVLPGAPARAADTRQVTVTSRVSAAAGVTLTFNGSAGDLHASDVTVDGGAIADQCGLAVVRDSGTPVSPPPGDTIVITWGASCVNSGEQVTFLLRTDNGPLTFFDGYWTDAADQHLGYIDSGDVAFTNPPAEPDRERSPVDWGCGFTAVRDAADFPGAGTWIASTYAYVFDLPDLANLEVTCWLQTASSLGVGEVDNTRRTCGGGIPQPCLEVRDFEIDATNQLYLCAHVQWSSGRTIPDSVTDGGIVDGRLRDVFSTGGITTLGGANDIVATVVLAVNNALIALYDLDLFGVLADADMAEQHTVLIDHDYSVAGYQCKAAGHAEGLVLSVSTGQNQIDKLVAGGGES